MIQVIVAKTFREALIQQADAPGVIEPCYRNRWECRKQFDGRFIVTCKRGSFVTYDKWDE